MFIKGDVNKVKKHFNEIIDSPVTLKKGDLNSHALFVLNQRQRLFDFAQDHKSPAYIIDKQELIKSLKNFKQTFQKAIPNISPFYAMKANPHPFLVKTAAEQGYGIDVSSGMELQVALTSGAQNILFTGPGKTYDELGLAIANADKVTLNIDSFSELKKIQHLCKEKNRTIRCGIRIYSEVHGSWSKFGIPLDRLHEFWQMAQQENLIDLQGIQFHMSFNETTNSFIHIFKELNEYLKTEFTEKEREAIKFIDFGGGYLSHEAKAFYPGASMRGSLITTANSYFSESTEFVEKYYLDRSLPLEQYASEIAAGIQKYLTPLLTCKFYCEPGRIIADRAMHILLQIVDVKDETHVITDAGTSAMGWRVYSGSYLPIINLTHPAPQELSCTIFGSLCTPSDVWSYYCYASKMKEGDYLLIPFHGGYTYAFAQNFIKAIPEVFVLK